MKRKYEYFLNQQKLLKRIRVSECKFPVAKRYKKNPMIRFIALFRGYITRKWFLHKMYPFYT